MRNSEGIQKELATLGRVTIEPSPVMRSPYEYVKVWLPEGMYLLVSDGAEYDEDGWLVGLYDEDSNDMDDQDVCEGPFTTDEAAIEYARKLGRG